METLIPFETRSELYASAKRNDNVNQLQGVYQRCHKKACEKREYYEKQLNALCKTCNPEQYRVTAIRLNNYEGLALDYLEYGLELEEGTHSNFINQGE